jgi:hypothetical protein
MAIRLASTDKKCQDLLDQIPAGDDENFSIHYSQHEELFLRLPLGSSLSLPSFPIHHPVNQAKAEPEYLASLHEVLMQLCALLPTVFMGMSYFFDPSDIMKPCFYRLYKIGDRTLLYLLRVDLLCRPASVTIVDSGTNDRTSKYLTRDIYVTSEFIPLAGMLNTPERGLEAFLVEELIPDTWIGETGNGYTVKGIWADIGLSKFFTKLFLAPGKSIYPYYPLFCRYKTLCGASIGFSPQRRVDEIKTFAHLAAFLRPHLDSILISLKQQDFSETMPGFVSLKRRVPAEWLATWAHVTIRAALNDHDMKEFSLER